MEPGAGEVRIRQSWAGINFVDIYHRTGLYPLPSLPACLGVEAAGVIDAIGAGVTNLAIGQRVAWAGVPAGGYAKARVINADRLIVLPDDIEEQAAAAVMLRGITAHMLLHRVWPVRRGDTLLIHAAAGGLGQILTRWAKRLGAEVIGVVGGERKAELARAAGADVVIDRHRADFVAEVGELTGGRGVNIAYDGVGGETLLRTLDCVRPFGLIASIGQASGTLPDIPLADIGPRRSLILARPSVFAYMADRESYRTAAAEVFDLLRSGLSVEVDRTFPLEAAAEGHRALESGETVGSLLLDLR
ncbi:quinone oxidoreductase family protein [Rhizobium lusitanum]|uniref:quinone oxidoreductase family protein n=1 Tax=Rhizobium lusitanum TaxID=293958 RepID=UPI001FEE23C3|nr:quinone oxidoreductase [Rhizobium lusitanum]